jgi:hypothetical protein
MKTPTLLRNYPFASAYILGVYNGGMELLDYVYHKEESLDMFRTLNREIKKQHPGWVIDEVYWRGVDLAEGLLDKIINSEPPMTPTETHHALKNVVRNLNHHPRLVILAHAIGTKFITTSIKET